MRVPYNEESRVSYGVEVGTACGMLGTHCTEADSHMLQWVQWVPRVPAIQNGAIQNGAYSYIEDCEWYIERY
jgi:hypothetical protein